MASFPAAVLGGFGSIPGAVVGGVIIGVLQTLAGPEIGVASTKAFTCQLTVLLSLALAAGRARGTLSAEEEKELVDALIAVPGQMSEAMKREHQIEILARELSKAKDVLYLGRGTSYPLAMEGALKLKEISYIHAEGYPAAEMKHGPIALVDAETPSVFLMPRGSVFDKVMSNLEEIKARGGPIIAIASENDDDVAHRADDVIYVPDVPEYLQPIVVAIPLQLLAYEIALLRGCDVDKPRNLAKSVTVE